MQINYKYFFAANAHSRLVVSNQNFLNQLNKRNWVVNHCIHTGYISCNPCRSLAVWRNRASARVACSYSATPRVWRACAASEIRNSDSIATKPNLDDRLRPMNYYCGNFLLYNEHFSFLTCFSHWLHLAACVILKSSPMKTSKWIILIHGFFTEVERTWKPFCNFYHLYSNFCFYQLYSSNHSCLAYGEHFNPLQMPWWFELQPKPKSGMDKEIVTVKEFFRIRSIHPTANTLNYQLFSKRNIKCNKLTLQEYYKRLFRTHESGVYVIIEEKNVAPLSKIEKLLTLPAKNNAVSSRSCYVLDASGSKYGWAFIMKVLFGPTWMQSKTFSWRTNKNKQKMKRQHFTYRRMYLVWSVLQVWLSLSNQYLCTKATLDRWPCLYAPQIMSSLMLVNFEYAHYHVARTAHNAVTQM